MKKIFNDMDLKGKLLVALVFVILGFMLSVQYRTTLNQKTIRMERVEDLSERLKVKEAENAELLKQIEDFRRMDVARITNAEMQRLSIMSGSTEVYGPGVEVFLDDSKLNKNANENPNLYVIHDEDLLRVLNELRAAGAEAISINDQRIVAMSEVRCAGPTISVNNVRSAAPYTIKAIGVPKTLDSALRIRGGVVETFEFWGISVKIKTHDKVVIPALTSVPSVQNVTIVEKKEENKK